MTAGEKQAVFKILCRIQDVLDDGFERERRIPAFMDDFALENDSALESNAAGFPSRKDGIPSVLGDSMSKIGDEVLACRKCRLCGSRRRPILGDGVADPMVLVVGDNPSSEDDECGIPFSGESGQLLDKMLESIGLSRSTNCYLTTIVKCKPPFSRESLPDEQEACLSFLDRQIAILNPKYIIAAGRVPAQIFLGSKDSISALRGTFGEYRGRGVMPTYHPAALVRDPSLKRPVWEDLKKFKESLDG